MSASFEVTRHYKVTLETLPVVEGDTEYANDQTEHAIEMACMQADVGEMQGHLYGGTYKHALDKECALCEEWITDEEDDLLFTRIVWLYSVAETGWDVEIVS
jgi:hypothetical protein